MPIILYRPYKDKSHLIPIDIEYFNGELVYGELKDADPNTRCLLIDYYTGLIVCSGSSKDDVVKKYHYTYKQKFKKFKRENAEKHDLYRAEYTTLCMEFNSNLEAQKGVKIEVLEG